jgi:hypothetical protein
MALPLLYTPGKSTTDIGRGSHAPGSQSIAIGATQGTSGAPLATDGTFATGAKSQAIGAGAKATGAGSVQIGTGTNAVANTIKFQGDFIATVRVGVVTPVGAVVPAFIGQVYIDTVTKLGYLAVGAANTDWKQITNAG